MRPLPHAQTADSGQQRLPERASTITDSRSPDSHRSLVQCVGWKERMKRDGAGQQHARRTEGRTDGGNERRHWGGWWSAALRCDV